MLFRSAGAGCIGMPPASTATVVPTIEQIGATNSTGAAFASNGHRPLRPIARMASQAAKRRVVERRMVGADYTKRTCRGANAAADLQNVARQVFALRQILQPRIDIGGVDDNALAGMFARVIGNVFEQL